MFMIAEEVVGWGDWGIRNSSHNLDIFPVMGSDIDPFTLVTFLRIFLPGLALF